MFHPHSIPAPSLFYPHSIKSQCRIYAGSMLALRRLHYGRNYFSFILVKFQVIEKHIWIFICRNTRFCIWTFICRNKSFYVNAGSIPAPSLLHPHSIQALCRLYAGYMLALRRLHYNRNYFSLTLVNFQVIERHIWIFICMQALSPLHPCYIQAQCRLCAGSAFVV